MPEGMRGDTTVVAYLCKDRIFQLITTRQGDGAVIEGLLLICAKIEFFS